MQILFISEEAQVLKFLSGLQAEAMMAQGDVNVAGISEENTVTVICSGESAHYPGTITKIDNGYQSFSADGKWLGMKIMVRRNSSFVHYDLERNTLND